MAFQVSPGVVTKEVDKTNVVPPVSSGIGVMVGHFSKGPVEEITIINSEEELVNTFGKPNTNNYEDWFTAANFLQYSSNLRVIRADAANAKNAVGAGSALDIKNRADYDTIGAAGSVWTAKTMGAHGNALKVSICAGANGFSQKYAAGTGGVNGAKSAGDTSVTVDDGTKFNVGDIITFDGTSGADTGHTTKYEVTNIAGAVLTIRQSDQVNGGGLTSAVLDNEEITRRWKFHDLFDSAPATSTWAADKGYVNDEMHIVVYDHTGAITGFDADAAGQRTAAVLETFGFVSQGGIAKTPQGGSNYYVNVLNDTSKHVYWGSHHSSINTDGGKSTPTDGTTYVQPTDNAQVIDTALTNGVDATPSVGEKKTSLDLLDNDTTEVDLIMSGACGSGADGITHAQNVVALAEARKDAVAFISPRSSDVVGGASNSAKTTNVTTFFGNLNSSSYCVFDSGYKYMFDRFNNEFRYIPLNGDMAGLMARTSINQFSWFSPAGASRGAINGAVKLAFNPSQAQRDLLYPKRINPVVFQPGSGIILFGDKTGLGVASAFDRINVRRLFLTVESTIERAARAQLFEFNDVITRSNFLNIVEPFLRDIKAKRGITDFVVVCDESNNTPDIIDSNQFRADIFIKPVRSINFIGLTFVATRTGVSFEEVVGNV